MKILSCVLNVRIANLPSPEAKIQLFCEIEKEKVSEFLIDSFVDHTASCLVQLFTSKAVCLYNLLLSLSNPWNFFFRIHGTTSLKQPSYLHLVD